VVLAILGNAYIASGLAAASQAFYRERVPQDERSAVGGQQSAGTAGS
jgi:hypothetical protein